MTRYKRFFVYFFYLIMVILLLWTLVQINLEEVCDTLYHLKFSQVFVLILLNFIFVTLLGVRWQYFLIIYKNNISLKHIIAHRLAGFSVSYFTPGPQFGGEPLQVYLLRYWNDIPAEVAISSVLLDRLVDFFVNIGVLAVCIVWIWHGNILENGMLSLKAVIYPVLFLCAMIALFLCYKWKYFPLSFILRVLLGSLYQKIQQSVYNVEKKIIETTNTPFVFIYSLFLSLIMWGITFVEFWATFYFLGQPLAFMDFVVLLTATRIALLMPVPGGIGTIEATQVFVLQLLHLPPHIGIAASIIIRIRDIFIATIGFLWTRHVINKLSEE